jgi:acyl-CoA thioester hydrolase
VKPTAANPCSQDNLKTVRRNRRGLKYHRQYWLSPGKKRKLHARRRPIEQPSSKLGFVPPAARSKLATVAAPVFLHTHRVTYAECTAGNHVYHSRFLDLLEAARGEFFRKLGATFQQWQERDYIFPVIECRVRFKAAARYDDVLTIEIWPTLASRARLNFAGRILNQAGALIGEAETFHACTGLNDRPKRLPEELVARLQPYLRLNSQSPDARPPSPSRT